MNWLDLLKSRTIWAGVGLWALAIYQLTAGQFEAAVQSFLAGLAAWGLRVAVSTPVAVEVEVKRDDKSAGTLTVTGGIVTGTSISTQWYDDKRDITVIGPVTSGNGATTLKAGDDEAAAPV